jgi:hypothetical protein
MLPKLLAMCTRIWLLRYYRNSWDDLNAGEDYADMGANWVMNSFAYDAAGAARYGWTEGGMAGWIALAVAHNQ